MFQPTNNTTCKTLVDLSIHHLPLPYHALTCIAQEYSLLPHHQPFCHPCTHFSRPLAPKIPQFARLVPHCLLDLKYPPL
jgi:hypothetical protein